ncbi:hypothetical protein E5288_WYG015839 [Bos mutus]|uniref:Uncharacterized protein n=1 Tax=Bos mutus TaxID=72004 RepID=A0A6B0RGN8_9CETA|nr:hypothetical protein [Bos mutus]
MVLKRTPYQEGKKWIIEAKLFVLLNLHAPLFSNNLGTRCQWLKNKKDFCVSKVTPCGLRYVSDEEKRVEMRKGKCGNVDRHWKLDHQEALDLSETGSPDPRTPGDPVDII